MESTSPPAGSTMGAGLDFDTPLTSPEWGSALPEGPVRSRVGDSPGVRCPRHWRYGRGRPSLSLPRRGYPSSSPRKYTANPRGALTAAETPSRTLKWARPGGLPRERLQRGTSADQTRHSALYRHRPAVAKGGPLPSPTEVVVPGWGENTAEKPLPYHTVPYQTRPYHTMPYQTIP